MSPRTVKAQSWVDQFSQFISLKLQGEAAVKQAAKIKEPLKQSMVDGEFDEANENGSRFRWFPKTVRAMGQTYRGMEARRKQPEAYIDVDKAEKVLKKLGLWEEATTPQIDPDKIYVLVQTDKLQSKDYDRMLTTPEPTWAFYPVPGEVDG